MSVVDSSHFFSSFGSGSIFSIHFQSLNKSVNKLKAMKQTNQQWGQLITNFEMKEKKVFKNRQKEKKYKTYSTT